MKLSVEISDYKGTTIEKSFNDSLIKGGKRGVEGEVRKWDKDYYKKTGNKWIKLPSIHNLNNVQEVQDLINHYTIQAQGGNKNIYNYLSELHKKKEQLNKIKKTSIKEAEKEIIKLGYEHGYCFNNNTSIEEFNYTEKQKYSCPIPIKYKPLLKGNIFTHNHIRYKDYERTNKELYEIGSNLSNKDILFAFDNELKEIRVVSGKYIYSISKKDNNNFNIEDKKIYYNNAKIISKDICLKTKENYNRYTEEEKQMYLTHIFIEEYCRKNNYIFKKELL